MNHHIHLAGAPGRPWFRTGRAHATGTAYLGNNTHFAGRSLAAHLDGSPGEFASRVAALSGSFAAVLETDDVVLAASDRIRSIPLFYGETPAGIALSDDARWVAEQVGARLDSAPAAAELLLGSCTTGASTLSSAVRQVLAGEIVRLGRGPAGADRYFRYGTGEVLQEAEEDLFHEGVRLFEAAFEALLASARDRPIAVPLSGGMDSRLVAAMIVRGGRTDALCFSYGNPFSHETRASRAVARALGLRWEFVRYTSRAWYRWFRSPRFQQFRLGAGGLSTIEHEQDWPAVKSLVERGIMPRRTIVMPGHGGYLSGRYISGFPPALHDDPVEAVWRKYYIEWPTSGISPELEADLRHRIRFATEGLDSAAAYTVFGWQERHAKMIANSVRVYEDHGLDWRLPLWADTGVVDFWGRLPLALRLNRRLYLRVVRHLVGEVFDLPSTIRPDIPLVGKLRRGIDADFRRYGIWLGAAPLARGLVTPVASRAVVDHPVVGPVVRQLAEPIAARPLQWATINGLLALEQLRSLARELG